MTVREPTRFLASRTASERGGTSLWIIIMLTVLMMFVGISFDVGNLLAAKREADNMAGTAARAAAQRVTEASLYARDDLGQVTIDPEKAQEIAEQIGSALGAKSVLFEQQSATPGRYDVAAVTIVNEVNPTFLALFGMKTVEVEGYATVRVRSAIEVDDYNVQCYDNVGGGC